MPAVPIISGIVATEQGEFVESLPLNLEPVAVDNKIAKGQLRTAMGATKFTFAASIDRGGVTWNDRHYRVSGTDFVHVAADGTVTKRGDVFGSLSGGSDRAIFDYSFDRLGIVGGGSLFYFDGTNLIRVTDEDLGAVYDMAWIDGYFATTDGKSIVVTELADPTSIKPLKYGSAEDDPDMVTGLAKLGGELLAFGRHTIQFFRNVGGNGFPFQDQPGATIAAGCVGPAGKCPFAGSIAFVGGGRNEGLGVYLVGQGAATKLSTRAIDDALARVADPTIIELESRVFRDEQRLYVHLPDETLVYLLNVSAVFKQQTWYRTQSGFNRPYRIRNAVAAYGGWICGDARSGFLARIDEGTALHFGEQAQWQFDCGLLYNDGKGVQVHDVELIGLPGRGGDGTLFLSMTRDGAQFTTERALHVRRGERGKRMAWRPHATFRTYMGLRFRGLSDALPGFAACNIEAESLSA